MKHKPIIEYLQERGDAGGKGDILRREPFTNIRWSETIISGTCEELGSASGPASLLEKQVGILASGGRIHL